VRWLKAAADKGEMRAQYVLGIVHWNGDGAAKSLPLAYAYLVRAAAQGLPEATKALNELSQVIQPLDRANGWQIATALANGSGIPAQFQPGIQPPPMLAVNTPPPAIVVASAPAAPAAPSGSSTAALNAAALKAADADAGEGDTEEAQDPPPAAEPVRQPAPAASPPLPAPPAARPNRAAEAAAERKAAAEKAAAEKRAAEKKLAAQKAAEAAKETGWRIQLGTYPNQKSAMQAWTKLAAANKKATKGLRPVIGKFGGNYRLQVGPFPTRDEARDGCKTLEIGKNGCFALNID
jgi:cell division protein FtsN